MTDTVEPEASGSAPAPRASWARASSAASDDDRHRRRHRRRPLRRIRCSDHRDRTRRVPHLPRHRRPHRPGDADARRDGHGEPVDGLVLRLRPEALGGWAGFSVAWLYWYFWVIVVGFEAVAGAQILTYWLDAPLWLLSLGLMVLMTAPTWSRWARTASSSTGSPASRSPRSSCSSCLGPVRPRAVARPGVRRQQPDRARRVPAERRRRRLLQHRRRGVLHGRRRDRHGGGSRVARPREGDRARHPVGDRAGADLLRGLGVPAGLHPAVGRQRARRLAVRRRVRRDGHPVRRRPDERRRAHRRALLPQLGALHGLAHALRARRAA